MTPFIQLTREPIALDKCLQAPGSNDGAQVFFSGHVRDLEDNKKIQALAYEAYEPMAEKELKRLVKEIQLQHPVSQVRIIHRLGIIPVSEAAIAIRVSAPHRREALAFVETFMDRLKQDVPIWKTGSQP
ncbi:MAG: molybdenum cofactor biosynthesis protein MoaE [Methylacidiphilales bacterium]|nr:molybdenum cofactor biosynthesis protein MoaE [Candidatus Methylacidiphilales bacterium]